MNYQTGIQNIRQKTKTIPEQMPPESKKEIKIMADKIIIDGQELENVSGGQAGGGYNLTVGDCNGNYLALRPQPV